MSRVSAFREMTSEQLESELVAMRKQLFELRFQSASEKLDKPSELRRLRRDIARVQTLRRQREITAMATAGAEAAAS